MPPNLPPRHVLRIVAALQILVVHHALIARALARLDAVQADVEPLTVIRMRIVRVRDDLPVLVHLLRILRTLEAVVEFLCGGENAHLSQTIVPTMPVLRNTYCWRYCHIPAGWPCPATRTSLSVRKSAARPHMSSRARGH